MNRLLIGVASWVLTCGMAWAQQVASVYDIGVSPDSPNKKVTVTYRLAPTDSGTANVDIDISSNAGNTWTVPANTFYPGSDVGPGIPANGTLRQLVWDARVDWNQQYSTQMLVRLNATAAELQQGLFITAGDKIYRMNLDGTGLSVMCTNVPKSSYLEIDYANHKLLLNNWYSGSQVMAYDLLRGGQPTLLYNGPGYTGGQGLAYDPEAQKLFLGMYYHGVYMMDLQAGHGWQRIVDSSALSPMHGERGGMVLDKVNGQIYFRTPYNSTCDRCRWIWRVNYDGSGLTKIIQANHGDGLAIDFAAGQMYFSDGPPDGPIMRANLDGSGLQTLLSTPAPYLYCYQIVLDVPGNKMYLYLSQTPNHALKAIARANLDGTGYEILRELNEPAEGWGFVLFNP